MPNSIGPDPFHASERLHRALQSLPDHYREVIHWRNCERMSFEDIGVQLGRSADAVRRLLARAVENLQAEMETQALP